MINSNEFYAGLTPLYHFVYPDWGKSLKRQADMLDSVIHEMWSAASEVLDVSCGIGTQTLGLAGLGYVVTASDLSSEEVNRAKQEAAQRELSVDFSVADIACGHSRIDFPLDVRPGCSYHEDLDWINQYSW